MFQCLEKLLKINNQTHTYLYTHYKAVSCCCSQQSVCKSNKISNDNISEFEFTCLSTPMSYSFIDIISWLSKTKWKQQLSKRLKAYRCEILRHFLKTKNSSFEERLAGSSISKDTQQPKTVHHGSAKSLVHADLRLQRGQTGHFESYHKIFRKPMQHYLPVANLFVSF